MTAALFPVTCAIVKQILRQFFSETKEYSISEASFTTTSGHPCRPFPSSFLRKAALSTVHLKNQSSVKDLILYLLLTNEHFS
jgi:hypothetical protein